MPSLHLTDFNEAERADYMVVVASMSHAQGEATSEDLFALRELCMRYVLGPDARGRVLAATSTLPDHLENVVKHLAHTQLRYSLFLDVCTMAYHHGSLGPAEEAEVLHIADLLHIKKEQADAIEDLAHLLTDQKKPHTHDEVEKAIASTESHGVPHGALAIAATLLGLHEEKAPIHQVLVGKRK
jgi:uncharacterized tellurite resistance protein B-like protein